MAAIGTNLATTVPGGRLNVLVGNGANPEVFTYVCGVTTNGLQRTVNIATTAVPDCDDPEAILTAVSAPVSIDSTISGNGTYNPDNIALIEGLIGTTSNYRFVAGVTDAQVTAGYTPSTWEGPFVFAGYSIAGDRGTGALATITGLSWRQAGQIVFTPGNVPA